MQKSRILTKGLLPESQGFLRERARRVSRFRGVAAERHCRYVKIAASQAVSKTTLLARTCGHGRRTCPAPRGCPGGSNGCAVSRLCGIRSRASSLYIGTGGGGKSVAPLLKDGLRDFHSTATSSFQYEKVKHWLSSSQASTRSQAKSDAQSLGLNVPDVFDVNFGAHNSSTDFQEWKNDFINSDYSEYISNQHNVDVISRVSDTLVAAYATCVNHRSGVQAWIDASSPTDFQIFFKFITPEGTNINSVKILGFNVANAMCPGIHQYVGTQLASVRNIQCHKQEAQTASVSLNTSCCGLEEQPVFRPASPTSISGSYDISGTLGAVATKIIQHPLTYTFPATVAAANFVGCCLLFVGHT